MVVTVAGVLLAPESSEGGAAGVVSWVPHVIKFVWSSKSVEEAVLALITEPETTAERSESVTLRMKTKVTREISDGEERLSISGELCKRLQSWLWCEQDVQATKNEAMIGGLGTRRRRKEGFLMQMGGSRSLATIKR